VENSFAKGATELATQCAIQWHYELEHAIKGFRFMSPIVWLMMWRVASIIGGSMVKTYNP
jgi:hypothetical protein